MGDGPRDPAQVPEGGTLVGVVVDPVVQRAGVVLVPVGVDGELHLVRVVGLQDVVGRGARLVDVVLGAQHPGERGAGHPDPQRAVLAVGHGGDGGALVLEDPGQSMAESHLQLRIAFGVDCLGGDHCPVLAGRFGVIA